MKATGQVRRPWLLPLVPAYRAGLGIKNALYDSGGLKAKRLANPVISVGSLSAGGAGKTPVVMELVRLAKQAGHEVNVLTRGYGRTSRGALEVELQAPDAACVFGDEAVEISEVGRVFVGNSRYQAGRLAETNHASAGHLLDDGFQHRKLARNLEVVLVTAEDLNDTLLPAGNLRETFSSLKRADVVVLREEEAQVLQEIVSTYCHGEAWIIRREILWHQPSARPYVFCGIARPHSFLSAIRERGAEPCGFSFFPDHHVLTEDELRRLAKAASRTGADSLLCTRKDLVKIPAASIALLEKVAPLSAVLISVKFLDEELVRNAISDIFKA